jgi:putative YhdH/YhfP family quinone oxidoreductase
MFMENIVFNAFVVEETEGKFTRSIKKKLINELPPGELLIKVHYSSLNYKDALSAGGNKGVTQKYPHTPGIDAAGIIVSSSSDDFNENEKVIVTSFDLGMNTSGGFSEYIRVPSAWAVKLPHNMTLKESMMIGTAGLTAGMSVLRLTEQIRPDDGKIIVSGATGGVGSLSVSILSKLGYKITAITGKEQEKDYLFKLGASEVLLRKNFEDEKPKPLLREEYAGAIDTLGGTILDNIIKSTKSMGVVTCCGNAASFKLNLTVFPFILRGVSLIGIDSQNYPMTYRRTVWKKLAEEWKPEQIDGLNSEVNLYGINEKIDLMLSGKIKGRVLIKL